MGRTEGSDVNLGSGIVMENLGAVIGALFAVLILITSGLGVGMAWDMWHRGRSDESLSDFLARHQNTGVWPPPPRPLGDRQGSTDDGREAKP